jgi:NAD(P)-dependent dehydrogenase (short-subunit alcohol dehydrogenase family)
MAESKSLAENSADAKVKITTHRADISVEEQVMSFCREVAEQHDTTSIDLLFNNAGIAGGGSFVAGSRDEWERTFGVCWFGVYYSCRAFMPMLVAASEAHIINTSSVNGFWASLGPGVPHTAYCTAKFAVKGFSEALIEDLRVNAPHVSVSVVMPGHIGTEIVANTLALQSPTAFQGLTDADAEDLAEAAAQWAIRFRDEAPMTAAAAATAILDGVREGRWRILVGDDAHVLDARVREKPEEAYDGSFFELIPTLLSD